MDKYFQYIFLYQMKPFNFYDETNYVITKDKVIIFYLKGVSNEMWGNRTGAAGVLPF
jgi:hypothetical protein